MSDERFQFNSTQHSDLTPKTTTKKKKKKKYNKKLKNKTSEVKQVQKTTLPYPPAPFSNPTIPQLPSKDEVLRFPTDEKITTPILSEPSSTRSSHSSRVTDLSADPDARLKNELALLYPDDDISYLMAELNALELGEKKLDVREIDSDTFFIPPKGNFPENKRPSKSQELRPTPMEISESTESHPRSERKQSSVTDFFARPTQSTNNRTSASSSSSELPLSRPSNRRRTDTQSSTLSTQSNSTLSSSSASSRASSTGSSGSSRNSSQKDDGTKTRDPFTPR